MPSKPATRHLQHALNAFTERFLSGVAPLRADGDFGPATRKRIKEAKYYLGYTASRRTARFGQELLARLADPKDPRRLRSGTPKQRAAAIERGNQRRVAQRKHYRKSRVKAVFSRGVTTFDGRPVAKWLKPYLVWARQHGWQGTLSSGWRDPNYSRSLCIAMCGRPSCPGRCAGTSSNHVGDQRPNGAVDVSDYARFGRLMQQCPLGPRIFNALGAADPVHFSASGR